MLGLSAYYAATHSQEAAKLTTAFGTGIAGFQLGTPRDWPWQALLPWARSVSDWHAWGAHMSMGLSTGAQALNRPTWLAAAERDANLFETHQLVSFGPVNGLLPAPNDVSQIAYGAETTTDGLLSLGRATGKSVYRELGGISATWFFGNNPANATMYQQQTGVVYDGINGDGTVNHNSGAESTIEGLLAVMSVTNDPVARTYLGYDRVAAQTSYQKVEAESGALTGAATVVTPASAWTGEALWSNGAYVDLLRWRQRQSGHQRAASSGQYGVYIVFDKQMVPPKAVGVQVSVDGVSAGTDDEGGAGAQGDSPNSDYLSIDSVTAPRLLAAGPHTITLAYVGDGTTHARIDAILLQPLIEDKVLTDAAHNTLALYKSLSASDSSGVLPSPSGEGWAVQTYDRNGALLAAYSLHVRGTPPAACQWPPTAIRSRFLQRSDDVRFRVVTFSIGGLRPSEKSQHDVVEEVRFLQVDRVARAWQHHQASGCTLPLHKDIRLDARLVLIADDQQRWDAQRLELSAQTHDGWAQSLNPPIRQRRASG